MSGKKRVLCVDDHVDMCELMALILEDFDVHAEHTKAEGLRKAATQNFDLLLLDYYLPDGTGLELSAQIRDFDRHTPILIVTSSRTITHEQVLAVGAQGVIRKQHLPEVLPAAAVRALEVVESGRQTL